LLNIQHSQMTAYHPQSNGMVERFHRRLKDGSTPTQAVFGSPLILPGQFLDSPELASKNFLEQFSKTLSAAEHPSTRHNTAAAAA